MFWAEIHLLPDQHVFDGNSACKSATILHNLCSGSIFIFFQLLHSEILPSVTVKVKTCRQSKNANSKFA